MRAVFTEYAWDMNWCDPCAAEPLSYEELRGLGVFWLNNEVGSEFIPVLAVGRFRHRRAGRATFSSRACMLRYDAQHFPEDLVLQETADRNNFQARYVLRHPWKGEEASCPASEEYRREVLKRQENEARQLADLTGWKLADIRAQMNLGSNTVDAQEKWWQKLWSR